MNAQQEKLDQMIASLEARIHRVKKCMTSGKNISNENFMQATSFVLHVKAETPAEQPQQIQIAPTQVEFYDASWRDVLESIKQDKRVDCYQAFIANVNSQIDSKADICDLPEKADRHYVDTLLREITFTATTELDSALLTHFQMIRAEMTQAKSNVETIKKHFEENVEVLKNELAEYRKSLTGSEEEHEITLIQNLETKHSMHEKALQLSARTVAPIRRYQIYKTPYKKRSRPYFPDDLNTVTPTFVLNSDDDY